MNNVKPIDIHFTSHFKLSSGLFPISEEEKDYMYCVTYANVVGSLLYVMVCTILDISHAMSVDNRNMTNSRKEHWVAVKWMLQYLRGINDDCITFNGCNNCLSELVDSYLASDLDRSRST